MAARPRFILSSKLSPDDHFDCTSLGPNLTNALSKEDIHHLKNVLRLNAGDELELQERSSGSLFRCKIKTLSPTLALELIEKSQPAAGENGPTLIVALTRPAVLANIAEKCTEIGMRRLILYSADRTNRAPKGSDGSKNVVERLQRVVDAAVKQCQSHIVPQVLLHPTLEMALKTTATVSGSGKLLCLAPWERLPHHQHLTMLEYLFKTADQKPENQTALENPVKTDDLSIVIGPEGGFTAEEISLAERYSYLPVSLGAQTLRVDTAAMSACLLFQMAQSCSE